MPSSAREIVELNIEHCRKRLESEADPQKRRTIERLLKEEEARLAQLDQPTGRR